MENIERKQISYPYLPDGRSFLYVDEKNLFMVLAKKASMESNDHQQPTGAVIVSNDVVIASASNKNPLTSEKIIKLHKRFCVRHMLHIPSGQKYWLCPGCCSPESHAESRAIHILEKIGFNQNPTDLYLWGHWWCCEVCWKNMLKIPNLRYVYLLENSEILFNSKKEGNIIGK